MSAAVCEFFAERRERGVAGLAERAPSVRSTDHRLDVVQVILTLITADLWVAGLTTPAAHHRPPPKTVDRPLWKQCGADTC